MQAVRYRTLVINEILLGLCVILARVSILLILVVVSIMMLVSVAEDGSSSLWGTRVE